MIAVGVDAGASGNVAAVSRDGRVVATVRGGPANPTTLGINDAADEILRTVRRALEGEVPDAIYVGAAGAGREDVAETLRFLFASAYPNAVVRVGDDAWIALRSAVPQGPGIVLIAGTGSIALADDGARTYRLGGLGYLIGDEGSAFGIGREAVRALGRVYDGRHEADETTRHVEAALGVRSREELLDRIYDRPIDVAQVAALAPRVVAAAGRGSSLATRIVRDASRELADLVADAARVSGLLERDPAVVLCGGLLRDDNPLTVMLEARILSELPGATLVRGAGEAHHGALRIAEMLARQAAG